MSNNRKRRINNRTVNALAVETDTVFWDRRLAGFGVRAYPSGARVYIAQARGPSGTRRVTLGRHGVVYADKARRRAALAIARIVAGEDPVPQRTAAKAGAGPTVAEVAERYLREHTAVQCKPRTLEIRRTVIANHIVPAMGKVALAAVRPEHAIELHQRMAGIPAQANIAIATLSHIFGKAQVWSLVEEGENPCLSVTRYRSRKRERFLTEAEFARLGRVLEEAPAIGGASAAALAAIRLLTLTGCRRNEILTLRWEDVNLPGRELRLRDAKTGPRTVPLAPAAVKVLAGLPWSGQGEWVIPGRKPGTHLRKLGNTWRVLRARADLPDVRLHDLRHSVASRALALGEELPMIGKLLGHRRIESTVRYAHLARTAVHQAAERVANSLAEDIL